MTKFLTISELQNKTKEKEKRTLEIFNIVLNECYEKIMKKNKMQTYYTFYKVPQFVMGQPLYNFDKLMTFIIKKLQKGGFDVYVNNDTILINWLVEKPKKVSFKEDVEKVQLKPKSKKVLAEKSSHVYEPSMGKLTKTQLETKMKEITNMRKNDNYFNSFNYNAK